MTLTDRAAAALDATHDKLMVGLYTQNMRHHVALWLDGKLGADIKKIRTSFIRKAVAYLEMISRSK